MNLSIRNIFLFCIFSAVIFSFVYCGNENSPITNNQQPTTEYLNHSDTARYVGMDQCKLCHQDIYNSFLETGMGKSFEHASKQKSSAKFDKHSLIYDKFSDLYYRPFWEGDHMKILEFRLEGKDTIYKRTETVDYIIGSGQHTNSHIQNVNGYLNQMPMTFYTQKGSWDFPPGYENGFNTRFSRKIGLECMSCHNSYPQLFEGSENKYNSIPEGINCERCHGPGSIHVQQRANGSKIDTSKYIDYSIVNPGKLSVDLQFDVCQRCHLQGNTILKEGRSFYDFKPGMKLSDHMTTFLPRYEGAEDEFIMASHADRLKQSQCFIQTSGKISPDSSKGLRPYKNALTCVTCHNPHKSVKVTEGEVFNGACKNCHSAVKKTSFCSEKPEARAKKQDNCVSCHMPRSGSTDIPHVTVHDHFIRKPMKKDEVEKVKKFIALEAVNEKDPDDRTKARAYILQYDKFEYEPVLLDSAEIILTRLSKTNPDMKKNLDLLVHFEFIRKDYQKIISYVNSIGKKTVLEQVLVKQSWDNNHAWTLYRIGEAYYFTQDIASAYECYKKADALSPYNPEFKNKIGIALMAQQKIPDAIVAFEATLKENPKFVKAMSNLGYAYLVSGNEYKAEALYNRALALDPDYPQLLMNVAGFNIYKKKYKEAEIVLKRILKKDPKNEQAKQILEQINTLK